MRGSLSGRLICVKSRFRLPENFGDIMGDIIVWIVSAIAEIIGENYFIRKQKEIDEKNRLISMEIA